MITYYPPAGLMPAYKVARLLHQPLLLTGEPGTGKTKFAEFVAQEEGLGKPIVFDTQTVSLANDLFYRFDTLGYFSYANKHKTEKDALDDKAFRQFTGLGKAWELAKQTGKRAVVLIDEIDKAPRDFPNDLLGAIETMTRYIPETRETLSFDFDEALRPIVIITSNSEKNLPDAFLRRVVYFNIPFPGASELLRILEAKKPKFPATDLEVLVAHFLQITGREPQNAQMRKQPATAELISWIDYLHRTGFEAKYLINDKIPATKKEELRASYSILAKTREDLNTLLDTLP